MSGELATIPMHAETLSKVLLDGNLASLTAGQRVEYMQRVCESLGLNPLTKPFEFISLNGKLVMYAKRDCTEQLRKIHGVSISIVSREVVEGVYVVTAHAQDKTGRQDESIGAVPIDKVTGEARANAMMKTETKAKRRVTLSICGLGMLDETEAEPLASYQAPRAVVESPERIAGTHGEAPQDAGKASTDAPVASVHGTPEPATSKPRTAAQVSATGGPITPDQIKIIHVLLGRAGNITDEAYRKQLAVYRQQDGSRCVDPTTGTGTSKLLSKDQASHFISRLEDKCARQEQRAAQGVDIQAAIPAAKTLPLEDLMTQRLEGDEDEAKWLHSMFGVQHRKELTTEQAETALQLLLVMNSDAYDNVEAVARSTGRIR